MSPAAARALEADRLPLPLWRLLGGLGILAGFLAVLALLAPYYVGNQRLTRFERTLVDGSDDAIRSRIVDRARELGLPVAPGDIVIRRDGGQLAVRTRYTVKNLWFYPVDMHLQANTR